MVQNVFAQNCVAVVFLVSILLNLVLPKNMEAEKVTEQKKKRHKSLCSIWFCFTGGGAMTKKYTYLVHIALFLAAMILLCLGFFGKP